MANPLDGRHSGHVPLPDMSLRAMTTARASGVLDPQCSRAATRSASVLGELQAGGERRQDRLPKSEPRGVVDERAAAQPANTWGY